MYRQDDGGFLTDPMLKRSAKAMAIVLLIGILSGANWLALRNGAYESASPAFASAVAASVVGGVVFTIGFGLIAIVSALAISRR